MKTTSVPLITFLYTIYMTAVAAQSSPGIHCSLKGYDGGIESFMATTDGTYPGCSNACYQQPNCTMFAYAPSEPGSTEGDCQLYDTLTAKNWVRDDTSPYFFYDNGCETRVKQCNYQGVSRYHDPIAIVDTSDLSADQQSLETCRTRCTSEPLCKSYAWTQTSCAFYDVPVNGNFLYGNGSQPVSRFYDLTCSLTTSSTTPEPTTNTTVAATTFQTTVRAQTASTTSKRTIIVTTATWR